MDKKKTYPQDKNEWQQAIQQGIGVSGEEGRVLFLQGALPIEILKDWIKKDFSDDFGPHFVPALLRNINGLIAWVYGNGDEPYWPGSDGDKAVRE